MLEEKDKWVSKLETQYYEELRRTENVRNLDFAKTEFAQLTEFLLVPPSTNRILAEVLSSKELLEKDVSAIKARSEETKLVVTTITSAVMETTLRLNQLKGKLSEL